MMWMVMRSILFARKVSSRCDGDNKLKIRAVEGLSEESSAPDISTDSGSGSEEGFPSDSEDGGEMSEGGTKREGEDERGVYVKLCHRQIHTPHFICSLYQ
jgi:hypothetical protein